MKYPSLLFLVLILIGVSTGLTEEEKPDSPKRTLARELVAVMHLDQGANAALNKLKQMQAHVDPSLTNVSPEIKNLEDEVVAGCEKLKEVSISTYANSYSVEELQAAIDFYKSSLGQAWIEKQPGVQMAIASTSMKITPQIIDAFKKASAVMNESHSNTNTNTTVLEETPAPSPVSTRQSSTPSSSAYTPMLQLLDRPDTVPLPRSSPSN